MGASADGAEITTLLAPPSICFCANSKVVNIPVHSATTSVSSSFHGISSGFLSALTLITLLLTTRSLSFISIEPENVPWTESYFNK